MELNDIELKQKFGVYHRNTDYSNRGALAAKYKKIVEKTSKKTLLQINIPEHLVEKRKHKLIKADNDFPEAKSLKLDFIGTSGDIVKVEERDDAPFPAADSNHSSELNQASISSVVYEEPLQTPCIESTRSMQSAKEKPEESTNTNSNLSNLSAISNVQEISQKKRNKSTRIFSTSLTPSTLHKVDESSLTIGSPIVASDKSSSSSSVDFSPSESSRKMLQETTKTALNYLKTFKSLSKPVSKPKLDDVYNDSASVRMNKHALNHYPINITSLSQRFHKSNTDPLFVLKNISQDISQWRHNMMQTA